MEWGWEWERVREWEWRGRGRGKGPFCFLPLTPQGPTSPRTHHTPPRYLQVDVCVCVCVREREREDGSGMGEGEGKVLFGFSVFLNASSPHQVTCLLLPREG